MITMVALVNADKIISVSKEKRGNKDRIVLHMEKGELILETPFEQFLFELKNKDINPIEGWFAG